MKASAALGGVKVRPAGSYLAAGLVCALGYLAVAWISISLGWISSRPLYDGLTPLPPYRWVEPPEERVLDNEVPGEEKFVVNLRPDGTADPASVTTSDGQATVTFDFVSPLEGPSFDVKVTPLAPHKVSAAPEGGYFDGNAYQFEAFYTGTQTPVRGSFTAVLRFPLHARRVLVLRDGSWDSLFRPFATPVDQQVSARVSTVGTFVAAGRGVRPIGGGHSDDPEERRSTGQYRWVSPPAASAKGNDPPSQERFRLRVDSFGQTDVETVLTSDAQFSTSFDFLPEQDGLKPLDAVITPLDPAALGSPPKGLSFDGNAYKVEAKTSDGSLPTPLLATVSLRTQSAGKQVLFLGSRGWEALPDPVVLKRQRRIEAKTMALGTFVAASTAAPEEASESNPAQTALFGVAGAVLALGVIVLVRKRASRRSPSADNQ